MDALTSRISLVGSEPSGPEDYLSTSLGVIFPDDVMNQHGDGEHSLVYASPHLPRPLALELADPQGDEDRRLFSHFLWNASLLLAELVERDTLVLGDGAQGTGRQRRGSEEARRLPEGEEFGVRGLRCIELGAGTALPSIMAGLLGAAAVTVTDYPAQAVLRTLRTNVQANLTQEKTPSGTDAVTSEVLVAGHSWGEFPLIPSTKQGGENDDDDGNDDAAAAATDPHRHAYDRVMVADCLWMPWQHANLRRSIGHFLSEGPSSRAWVVAGFHTGRAKMGAFFDEAALRDEAGCVVEGMWERDCEGVERAWDADREDGITERKRWLVVAVLKRA